MIDLEITPKKFSDVFVSWKTFYSMYDHPDTVIIYTKEKEYATKQLIMLLNTNPLHFKCTLLFVRNATEDEKKSVEATYNVQSWTSEDPLVEIDGVLYKAKREFFTQHTFETEEEGMKWLWQELAYIEQKYGVEFDIQYELEHCLNAYPNSTHVIRKVLERTGKSKHKELREGTEKIFTNLKENGIDFENIRSTARFTSRGNAIFARAVLKYMPSFYKKLLEAYSDDSRKLFEATIFVNLLQKNN